MDIKKAKELSWRMRNGKSINIQCMDDSHLQNTIKMLKRNAKNKALKDKISSLSDKDKKVYMRERKIKRIANEPDFDLIWEKFVSEIYWDMIYEQKKRENFLFT